MIIMKSIHYKNGKLSWKDIEKPSAGRKEALVRVRYAGICSTDLEIFKGYMDFEGVPGHEFVGTIETPKKLAGRRVTGEINVSCGRCALCRRGLGKHCSDRTVLGIYGRNGAFAEYLTLPVSNLHAVPDSVSDEEAVFTELLAAACEITERVYVSRSSRVAILGDGRLAAMAAQVVRLRTGNVTVIGASEGKLGVFRELGFSTLDRSATEGLAASFDVVVECTGSRDGLPSAVRLVRPQGTVVLKSTFNETVEWNPTEVAVCEISIVGSRCGPFEKALAMLEKSRIETSPFLTAVYRFTDWEAAIERASDPDSFKVLLDYGE